ncbi:MAG TPA: hypothetical protein VFS97_13500 [Nitrososphaeraceae archaeon]|nr:hypothetical protein [Nitrososphaeraceae archaeon]
MVLGPSRAQKRDRKDNGNCCFNNIIGLPKKDSIEKPLFGYEQILYRALLDKIDELAKKLGITDKEEEQSIINNAFDLV